MPRPTEIWTPLLEGAEAEDALRSIALIQSSFAGYPAEHFQSPSLASGTAGLALFWACSHETLGTEGADLRAAECLSHAIDSAQNVPLATSFFAGITGIAWGNEHLAGQDGGTTAPDFNAEFDDALRRHLSRSPWTGEYDLIHGLVGFGVYALERLPRPCAAECLALILSRLEELSSATPDGLAWFQGPNQLIASEREKYPSGYYNLTLAHGVTGIIGLLAQLYSAGVETKRCGVLLEGAIGWLLRQRLPDEAASAFPARLLPHGQSRPSRLAWCQGDLSIALALLSAGLATGETEWQREALALAQRAAARPDEKSGVVDACLCHGSAGLAHLFNRMYQATQDPVLATAARHWYGQTLKLRQHGRGIAGFSTWGPSTGGSMDWRDDSGLLTGAAGVGLSLLTATSRLEPSWDRIFLTALPSAPGPVTPCGAPTCSSTAGRGRASS